MKVGSPADSLNAMVVNSVTMENESASYSRRGPVLSFFHKPDVSYYGGDGNRQDTKIALCIDNIWDEPLNYIDVFTRMQIEKLIETYRPTMLLVEHDVTFKEKIANKVIRL